MTAVSTPPVVAAQHTERPRAVVVGAGLGGLAAALRLQQRGYDVTVLEKNAEPGGRCNRWSQDGFTFDTGPTLLLMRDVLDDLFRDSGYDLDDHLDLVRHRPNYRITFADGETLTVTSELPVMHSELERFERGAGDAYLRFLADAGWKYRVSREKFVERSFERWSQFLTPANLPRFLDSGALRRLTPHMKRYFRDPRLQIAFSFQSMYLGISPATAPAVYALLPYTEIAEGIWYPRGGMYRIVEALVDVLQRGAGTVRCGETVASIVHDGRRATGVALQDGRHIDADVVVCNVDLPWAYEHLLQPRAQAQFTAAKRERLRYGSSAYMMYLGVRGAPASLVHHNVYIGSDVEQNFRDIFDAPRVPEDPAIYVNVSSRTDPWLAPEGHDAVYVLAPSPLAGAVDWEDAAPRYRQRVLKAMTQLGFEDIEDHIVTERVVTPEDWATDYSLRRGATFGIAHDLFQVGVMRPQNRHRDITNLYFVGASTQPGGGIPMVFLGARSVVERIVSEQGATQGAARH